MSRSGTLLAFPICLTLLSMVAHGESRLTVPDASIGKNLQAFTTVALSTPAPDGGLEITLTSTDEHRLVLSKSPLEKGAGVLTLKVRPGFRESSEFWLQGLSAEGVAKYRASANGYAEGVGAVTLTPSAIVLRGPFGSPSLQTNAGAAPIKLSLTSVRLDSSLANPEEQLLAIGPALDVQVSSSNPKAGTVSTSSVAMKMASSAASVEFQPAGEGETILSVAAPEGFSKPPSGDGVTANVRLPGLAISDQLTIGQNLQVAGVLSLGVAAPAEGVSVTLTSKDPQHLLLSDSATKIGSASLTLNIRKGMASGSYYLQALGGSGTVEYVASATGFRERTAAVTLAPAGIVLTPAAHGPPDEAQVLRKDPGDGTHVLSGELKKGSRTPLVAWTVQLDPVTHRSADITVQPLRAGLILKVPLVNSQPKIGKIASTLTIAGGSEHSITTFRALRAGSTTISVETPGGFTRSANSTSVIAVVGP